MKRQEESDLAIVLTKPGNAGGGKGKTVKERTYANETVSSYSRRPKGATHRGREADFSSKVWSCHRGEASENGTGSDDDGRASE